MMIPEDSKRLIEAAIRMMKCEHHEEFAETVINAVYGVGWADGGMATVDQGSAMLEEAVKETLQ